MRILILFCVLSGCTINREPMKQKNKDQFLIGSHHNQTKYIPIIPEE